MAPLPPMPPSLYERARRHQKRRVRFRLVRRGSDWYIQRIPFGGGDGRMDLGPRVLLHRGEELGGAVIADIYRPVALRSGGGGSTTITPARRAS